MRLFSGRRVISRHFTLVEILAVMAIIAILMGIGIGVYGLAMDKAKRAKTESLIKKIEVALEAYKAQHGYYIQTFGENVFYLDAVDGDIINPPSAPLNGTTNPEYNPKNNFAKFIDLESTRNSNTIKDKDGRYYLVDAWGFPIYYRCPGNKNTSSFDVVSTGPDGKIGDNVKSDWNNIFRLFEINQNESSSNHKKATRKVPENDARLANLGKGDDIANY